MQQDTGNGQWKGGTKVLRVYTTHILKIKIRRQFLIPIPLPQGEIISLNNLCSFGKEICLSNAKCLGKNIVYRYVFPSGGISYYYIGARSTTFKMRLANHQASFKDKEKIHSTNLLSRFIRSLQDRIANFDVKWEIIGGDKKKNNLENRE